MQKGTIIKNGNTPYFVLAVEEGKALLYRQSDGEVVVAVGFNRTGVDENGIVSYEWEHGHYYGNYMDTVLTMLEGLRTVENPQSVLVETSVDRAVFLASLGDNTYQDGLEAFASGEAVTRTDELIPGIFEEATPAQKKEIYEWVEGELYKYLKEDENALNYDGMDDVVTETITEYVTEFDMSMEDERE